jgi:hypothetical protein
MSEASQEPREAPLLGDDPIVSEVRAIRRRIWEAAGRDVRRFIEQTRRADQLRGAGKPTGAHSEG